MALPGSTQTLIGNFYDAPGGAPEDPLNITLTIYRGSAMVLGPINASGLVHEEVGRYRYDYHLPLNAAIGTYTVVWTSLQPGDTSSSTDYDNFEVVPFSQPVPPYNGCEWPIDSACETEEWLALDDSTRTRSVRLASSVLHRLSGYRVTNCSVTVRPGPLNLSCETPLGNPARAFYAGVGGARRTLTRDPRRVRLAGPIGRVDQVQINDAVLAAWRYRVEGNDLVRIDGQTWPTNPDLFAPLGAANTFSVTYINGIPVDSNAAYAAGRLAMEFARACSGSQCELPDQVTQIVRQGATIDIPTGAFPEGVTGLREVDVWVSTVNPGNLQRPARVYSPDIKPVLVVAGPYVPTTPTPDPDPIEDGGGAGGFGEIEEGGGA